MRKFFSQVFVSAAVFSAVMFVPVPSDGADPDGELSAQGIMWQVDAREEGDDRVSDLRMVLVDKNGDKRWRDLRYCMKMKDDDRLRMMFFLSPADVRGTGLLTYDYRGREKDDDQWLYLPALRKTRRIASGDRKSSFMGSDFSYGDLTKWEIDNYDYTISKPSVMVRGNDTWAIEAVPVDRDVVDRHGYEKSLLLVRKDIFLIVRAVHWIENGGGLKYMDVKKLELIDNIHVPTEIHMTTKVGGQTLHKTVLFFENVRFDQGLEESFFTVQRMEKGP